MGIRRIGKNILIDLDGGKTMFCHLKMTGHFSVRTACESPDPKARVAFALDDGCGLEFHDIRTFGFMGLADTDGVPDLPQKSRSGRTP